MLPSDGASLTINSASDRAKGNYLFSEWSPSLISWSSSFLSSKCRWWPTSPRWRSRTAPLAHSGPVLSFEWSAMISSPSISSWPDWLGQPSVFSMELIGKRSPHPALLCSALLCSALPCPANAHHAPPRRPQPVGPKPTRQTAASLRITSLLVARRCTKWWSCDPHRPHSPSLATPLVSLSGLIRQLR